MADEVRRHVDAARVAGRTVGVVPTMGALHEGHLSLARAARAANDVVVATIFVNPTQFGPDEDFDEYPRTFDEDLHGFRECGVDIVFAPTAEQIYPPDFSTYIEPPRVAERFEGECRAGHFRGVATVVLKLFNLVPADVAYFGRKDYQQSLVVRQMVADLNLPIKIVACPTVREPDGLALSSRNKYLGADDRVRAVALSRALRGAKDLFDAGERRTHVIDAEMRAVLTVAGIDRIDYASVADARTLEPLEQLDRPAVALIAAHVGTTRLIDNQLLPDRDV